MASDSYPLKNRRLEQLYEAGFNVADFVCFPPGTLKDRTGELKAFLEKHGRISCRHFHQDEKTHFKCPVKYDQTDLNVILSFCLEHNENFYTLCNEAINTKESLCAGNILVLNEETYFVEYFYGPGTPRDIESKGYDELKTFSRTVGQGTEGERPPDAVLRMAFEAKKFRPLDNKAFILEFSLYPYPIGKNQTHIICWEWRWGWLHYQLQANQHLLSQLKKANDRERNLVDEIEELRQRLRDAHDEHSNLHSELIVHGVRAETFGV